MWISRWLVWCDWYAPYETVRAYCKRQSRANHWKCAEAASVALPHLLSHRDRLSSQKAGSAWFSETIRGVHTAAESPSYASVGVWSTGGTHGCWPLCVSQGCKKEIILYLLWMPNGCLWITIWQFHVNNCLMLVTGSDAFHVSGISSSVGMKQLADKVAYRSFTGGKPLEKLMSGSWPHCQICI